MCYESGLFVAFGWGPVLHIWELKANDHLVKSQSPQGPRASGESQKSWGGPWIPGAQSCRHGLSRSPRNKGPQIMSRYSCFLCVCASSVAQSCLTPCNPMDYSPPGSSVHGIFSRQEYCRGLPFPSPGGHLDPGIEPMSPASPALAGGFLTTESPAE